MTRESKEAAGRANVSCAWWRSSWWSCSRCGSPSCFVFPLPKIPILEKKSQTKTTRLSPLPCKPLHAPFRSAASTHHDSLLSLVWARKTNKEISQTVRLVVEYRLTQKDFWITNFWTLFPSRNIHVSSGFLQHPEVTSLGNSDLTTVVLEWAGNIGWNVFTSHDLNLLQKKTLVEKGFHSHKNTSFSNWITHNLERPKLDQTKQVLIQQNLKRHGGKNSPNKGTHNPRDYQDPKEWPIFQNTLLFVALSKHNCFTSSSEFSLPILCMHATQTRSRPWHESSEIKKTPLGKGTSLAYKLNKPKCRACIPQNLNHGTPSPKTHLRITTTHENFANPTTSSFSPNQACKSQSKLANPQTKNAIPHLILKQVW